MYKYFKCINTIPDLNICVPFVYADWNPKDVSPHVVVLNQIFIKQNGKAKCFDNNGGKYFLYKKDGYPDMPVVTVGFSERVDNEGRILVDYDGFVIDESERKLTADDAYLEASMNLKSGKIDFPKSIVEIVDASYFDSLRVEEESLNKMDKENIQLKSSSSEENFISVNENNLENSVSVNGLTAPTIEKVVPSQERNKAFIQWTNVDGETNYEIQCRKGQSGTWGSTKTTGKDMVSFVSHWLENGQLYYFRVRAKNINTGAISDWTECDDFYQSCWRKGNATEVVSKVILDEDCAFDVAFLESHVELQAIVLFYDFEYEQVEYPKVDLGRYAKTEYLDGSVEANMWRYLFTWNMASMHAQNYYFQLWEVDDMLFDMEVTIGMTFKGNEKTSGISVPFSVKFKMKDWDDKIGFLDVYSHMRTYNGYSLQPMMGNAFVYIQNN
ncbi:MAG: fibronectin type III domain-containing protein [Prolixibacteraceae bacterium]|nr:fibronectin type III domain-containing protein [Prolixibacteraceae bacterium]